MILRSNIASGFIDELTLFRNPAILLWEVKSEVVWRYSIRLRDKSILQEISAGHWGTERGTS